MAAIADHMKIADIAAILEELAPPSLQESYDNSGLLVGNPTAEVSKALISLDVTEEVIDEAIHEKANLVIAHHPIVFKGLKRLNGANYVERTVIKAIQNNIAIYAIHTNLDNVLAGGVNGKIADRLQLINRTILQPKSSNLFKLVTFVPVAATEVVLNALFDAGAGKIGAYDRCSFRNEGMGTFRGDDTTQPHVGVPGENHAEPEHRIEVILPNWKKRSVLSALMQAHPYEEVAYDVYPLENHHPGVGSGLVGELDKLMSKDDFLHHVKTQMKASVIRFTESSENYIKRVAVCGGSGSFLIGAAKAAGADAYITGDVKYHEFFDAENQLMICDIGHYESEQFTIELLGEFLSEKIPTFAVIFTKTDTNPIKYFH